MLNHSSDEAGGRMVTLRNRRLACSNSRWNVYFDDVTDSSGRAVDDYLVLKSKTASDSLLSGVAVLPVIDGHIGLLHNYRHCVGAPVWEIVKGFIDESESAADAASRELVEEIGYSCPKDRLIDMGTYLPESGAMAARAALFLALDCIPAAGLDRSEFGLSELSLWPSVAVYRMAIGGEIEDSATLIALLRAQPRLNAG
jgi:ADP-ribose pyrophosphatase